MRWYEQKGVDDDTVISTRIRLARNLKDYPFSSKITAEQRKEINLLVKQAVENSDMPISKALKYIPMDSVPENERFSMVERHIISKEFANNYKGRAIIISQDESICIMLGEEDHIRIQVLYSGFCLEKAYETANLVDDLICSSLPVAFSEKLGFLTECTTNLGTGMRAGVMLHIPLLEAGGEIASIAKSAQKLGFAVRGMYGEGSKPGGSLYQISNQITLGITEQTAIDNLKIITENLVKKERERRKSLDFGKTEDICMRALGTLKYARILSSKEMMQLISKINLGKATGIIKNEDILPFKIFIEGMPYMLMKNYGNLTAKERDKKRADLIRESLKNI